jgi:DNA gyrase/topoisomerase IV subunit B
MSDINRDLEVLSDVEHIRLRPAMYVGSTSVTSDKTFI